MPYYIPKLRQHRQRTKSENANDQTNQPTNTEESGMDVENIHDKNLGMDMDGLDVNRDPMFTKTKLSQLKKSKSMESLQVLSPKAEETKASSTLEFVSSRIQKLKFNE